MATIEDLKEIMSSVNSHVKIQTETLGKIALSFSSIEVLSKKIEEQTEILKSMFDLQIKESERNRLVAERLRARRDGATEVQTRAIPSSRQEERGSISPTLSGILGGLGALFGSGILRRFSILGKAAAALAIAVGVTIGVVRGQLKAINVIFKTVKETTIQLSKLVKSIFSISKSLSSRIFTLTSRFIELIENSFKVSIKNFSTKLTKAFDDLAVSISKPLIRIKETSNKVLGAVEDIVTGVTKRSVTVKKTVVDSLDDFAKMFRDLFKSSGVSRFGKILDDAKIILKDTASRITSVFKGLKGIFDIFIEPFVTAFKTIKDMISPTGSVGRIGGAFKSIASNLGALGNVLGGIGNIVGKIFAPIAIITTAFQTIQGTLQGYAEGGILGAFKGGIDALLNSLIAAPLDLIKNIVGWVIGKFGFDETSEAIRDFSFQDLFKSISDKLFGFIDSVFSFFPSIEDIKNAVSSVLPDWLKPDSVEEQRRSLRREIAEQQRYISEGDMRNWRGKKREEIIKELQEELAGLRSFRSGTKGFMDFGSGSLANLHGLEAVVPRNTDAGNILAKNFDENWKLKLSRVENNLQNRSMTPVVINAPNNSQTNLNSRGGATSTVINSFGSGRSDIDVLSRPGGVF